MSYIYPENPSDKQKEQIYKLIEKMKNDGILDGDYVVIKKIDLAKAGETVVALVNGEATLKRYYVGSNGIELHPRNDDYEIINVSKDDNLIIQGKVLGVFREFN